ncbi:hypothetical protein [Thiothrix unzii]|uniref:Uncharacterized protein n=1 Tax=Thiothrix unzii TaxID=111769 RepID=A0A975FBI4_9GAMM|nr:hypothetical protein [Thiothrix unzii]QTR54523.1 hypothetical protein J9260_05375 [Thiothrix unzii]
MEGAQTLGRMTQTIVEIRAWMEKSQDVTDELDKSVETLEKDMATVKEAIARLQQQQPGGNPAPAPPANNDARLEALEARIAKLEANHNTVQAPFKVIDAAGKTLMTVNSDKGISSLRLGEPGNAMAALLIDGESARVIAANKSNIGYLNADANISQTVLSSNGVRTAIGSPEEGVNGMVISNADNRQPLGEMALRPGKKFALRLYDEAGKVVVSAGTNPTTSGSGTVMAANTQGENVAFVGTSSDGQTGVVSVAKGGKDTAALISEPRMIVLYNDAGEAITTLAKSQEGTGEGGNITIRQPDGEGIFSAGYNAEAGGGDACVYRAKKQNMFCLGIGVPGMGAIGR